MKQNKLIIHPSTSLLFLLFYSPKPRSQVRILIYRKWSISEGNTLSFYAMSRFIRRKAPVYTGKIQVPSNNLYRVE